MDTLARLPWVQLKSADDDRFAIDPDLIIHDVNEELCQLLGCSSAELIGTSLPETGLCVDGYCEIAVKNKVRKLYVQGTQSIDNNNKQPMRKVLFVYPIASLVQCRFESHRLAKEVINLASPMGHAIDLPDATLTDAARSAKILSEIGRQLKSLEGRLRNVLGFYNIYQENDQVYKAIEAAYKPPLT